MTTEQETKEKEAEQGGGLGRVNHKEMSTGGDILSGDCRRHDRFVEGNAREVALGGN